ncbi:MAG: tannase [Parasporobacterium sp.]|nr:tannase [Parasporobacterium sp.]
MKRITLIVLSCILCFILAACSSSKQESGSSQETAADASSVTAFSVIDNSKWQYNSDDDVYYQIGLSYCENPADESYENLAIFVPGAYMKAVENGDGTYTCEINSAGSVNGFTAETAPIVMPINTPGYSAQAALTDYTSVSDYMNAGFVYVHAGCRGRDAGAPAGVTDLKAAVRYIRYCDEGVPGDAESIFTFGMSGGGAQSSIMGATGDSDLYTPYLEAIGAVKDESDAVLGAMNWCPITNLDTADEAYEWMMGTTRSNLSEEEQAISDALAKAFATYINGANIKDEEGNVLTLEESDDGIYQSGSYYEYMKSVIEESLNNFLADTEFPYDASSASGGGMPGGPGGGEMPAGGGPGNGLAPDGAGMDGADAKGSGEVNIEDIDNITRTDSGSSGLSLSGTYETAQDYIDALNANGEWVTYDSATNTASISSIKAFVNNLKTASKNLGAFDQLDGGQGENTLFGYGDGSGAHFDSTLASILKELGNEYASAYESDLNKTDSAGNTVDVRVNMYTPLYYLLESSDGYQTSKVAKYWRIRTGINQGDCALSTEMNLALALENYEGVSSVDFETVWGQGHTQAERSGNSTENFISWVEECMK